MSEMEFKLKRNEKLLFQFEISYLAAFVITFAEVLGALIVLIVLLFLVDLVMPTLFLLSYTTLTLYAVILAIVIAAIDIYLEKTAKPARIYFLTDKRFVGPALEGSSKKIQLIDMPLKNVVHYGFHEPNPVYNLLGVEKFYISEHMLQNSPFSWATQKLTRTTIFANHISLKEAKKMQSLLSKLTKVKPS